MAVARVNHEAVWFNGAVWVMGGEDYSGPRTTTEVYYPPPIDAWTMGPDMNVAREHYTATALPNTILVAGGTTPAGLTATSETLQPDCSISGCPLKWVLSTNTMSAVRRYQTATYLARTNKVLVTGGFDPSVTALATSELYDVSSDSWSAVASTMAVARGQHHAGLVNDYTQVLVAGGCGNCGSGCINATATAELFTIATGSWTSSGNLPGATCFGDALQGPSGTVAVLSGGDVPPGTIVATPTVSTSNGTAFALSGQLPVGRWGLRGAIFRNGTAVALGGMKDLSSNPFTTEMDVFDPSTNAWNVDASMTYQRYRPIAVATPDNTVVVAGGQTIGYLLLNEVETLHLDPQGTSCTSGVTCDSGNCVSGVCSVSLKPNVDATALTTPEPTPENWTT
jgi:hypothetical protein